MSTVGKRALSRRIAGTGSIADLGHSRTRTKAPASIARYIPLVVVAGLIGLTVSLFVLAGYLGPLLRVLTGALK